MSKEKPQYLIKFEEQIKTISNEDLLDLVLEYHTYMTDDNYWPSSKEQNKFSALLTELEERLGIK